MPTQNGSLFSAGIRVLLTAPNTPLVVESGGGPIGYLHFKDSAGNTIVPTYERDGLQTAVGSFDGASIQLTGPSEAQFELLNARVAALEALENPVDVPWAANIVIDFATLGSRHAVITAEAGTFTLGTPLNTLPGRDYRITLLSGGGGDNAWGAAWDVTTAPWTGLLSNSGVLNGDPQLFTFTFRAFPGPKMRLVGAYTGAE